MAALGLIELIGAPKTDSSFGAATIIVQALQTIISFGKDPPVLRVRKDA